MVTLDVKFAIDYWSFISWYWSFITYWIQVTYVLMVTWTWNLLLIIGRLLVKDWISFSQLFVKQLHVVFNDWWISWTMRIKWLWGKRDVVFMNLIFTYLLNYIHNSRTSHTLHLSHVSFHCTFHFIGSPCMHSPPHNRYTLWTRCVIDIYGSSSRDLDEVVN